ncbi:hypothetical protein K457DRAFT_657148 [Linnemannia elongata AG-77]|uniref:Uncharacterized protein n=1 Tax=Linnemannia elongata AG-77 TaxID=1314771 RepID=A0A197KG03_9FUNG|nr:hypothetical protein K457DRAFT_657148 [Linnemannia elongata AG-77]
MSDGTVSDRTGSVHDCDCVMGLEGVSDGTYGASKWRWWQGSPKRKKEREKERKKVPVLPDEKPCSRHIIDLLLKTRLSQKKSSSTHKGSNAFAFKRGPSISRVKFVSTVGLLSSSSISRPCDFLEVFSLQQNVKRKRGRSEKTNDKGRARVE